MPSPPAPVKPLPAWLGYGMGVLLLGCALAVVVSTAHLDALQCLGVALLVAAGSNCIWAAHRRRRSWLERLGPLP